MSAICLSGHLCMESRVKLRYEPTELVELKMRESLPVSKMEKIGYLNKLLTVAHIAHQYDSRIKLINFHLLYPKLQLGD